MKDGAGPRGGKRGLPFFLAAALVLPDPAAAMWDGIRWNMSAAEVRAAAKGQAVLAEGRGGRRVKPTRRPALMLQNRLEGERRLGGQRVRATFWFDPAGRLWSVTEEPDEADAPAADACAGLEAALTARYGAPDLATEAGALRHLVWRDEARRTRAHFRDSGADCGAEYRELRGPLDR